ncbi:hypothetical protein [Tropicimonas isoalkanivorans]|uniref:Uncharacterized protein n=1 Tax=Tropicimonas isoalkanivorans TaxID=441112 RepID=A0A1I1NX05_9RHOB|nr:hypothetical protein [Tropicimonas isoalkanivorans]SFD01995.1 hypothetical protein SAMN04488094_11358 [Tropicimonas isoalkanivorans]
MSIWTFSPAFYPAALFGAALLVLGACTLQAPVSRATSLPDALRRFPVIDNAVVIAAPDGYCIDAPGSRTERRDSFVLLASCRAVTGDPSAPSPRAPGLLSASVDGAGTGAVPTEEGLDKFFASAIGRTVLSRRNDPDSVVVGERRYSDETYLLHVRERARGDEVMGLQSWRAIFTVNGRMVTATLRELAAYPMSESEGFRVVKGFADGIRRASP